MHRTWKAGLALGVGLLLTCLWAAPASADDTISGRVWRDRDADDEFTDPVAQPTSTDLPLKNVTVTLQRELPMDPPPPEPVWDPAFSRTMNTLGDGTYSFALTDLDITPDPLMPALRFRVTLDLSTYIPEIESPPYGAIPPLAPNFEADAVVVQPDNTVVPLPPPETRDVPPNGTPFMPSSGPLGPMGGTGSAPTARFPLAKGFPEKVVNNDGSFSAIVFIDRGECDAVRVPADRLVEGRMVRLEQVEPTASPNVWTATSNASGVATFPPVLTFETQGIPPSPTFRPTKVRVSADLDDDPAVEDFGYLVPDGSGGLMRSPDGYLELNVFISTDDLGNVEFTFDRPELVLDCEDPPVPPTGSIMGRVFDDENNNGAYDSGVDGPRDGVTMNLEDSNGALVPGKSATTANGGLYSFTALSAGSYTVVAKGVGENDADVRVAATVAEGVSTANFPLPVGGPKPCDSRESCTEGEFHEVVVETEIWVGDTALVSSIAAHAILYADCTESDPLGIASIGYAGTSFPAGGASGLNDIVHIEDVRLAGGSGWGTVRVRLAANHFGIFPTGSFGPEKRRLEISLNGRRISGCWRFQCDSMQPGTRFPGANGPFRVLSTWSRQSWIDCENPELPTPPPGGGGDDGGGDPGGGGDGCDDKGGSSDECATPCDPPKPVCKKAKRKGCKKAERKARKKKSRGRKASRKKSGCKSRSKAARSRSAKACDARSAKAKRGGGKSSYKAASRNAKSSKSRGRSAKKGKSKSAHKKSRKSRKRRSYKRCRR